MSKEVNVRYPPILGILGAVLVVAKLLGEIELAWIWVLAPFWGPWALMLLIILVPVVILGVGGLVVLASAWIIDTFDGYQRQKRRRHRQERL